MSTKMTLWRYSGGSVAQVPATVLASEEIIETAIESDPEILGIDVMIIGRQTRTTSGPLDLLAIDESGRLVVIENKRHRTPRDVVAQAIDYAAWVSDLNFDAVATIYAQYRSASGEPADLATDFEDHFGAELESVADSPRMVIVASQLDDSTERMIEFLGDAFDVPINAVLFQSFEGELIGRTWLRPDEDAGRAKVSKSPARSQSREESRQFWDAWLDYARPKLSDIRLPQSGQARPYIQRSVAVGIPAKIAVWVNQSEAYSEIQFEDIDPLVNSAWLHEVRKHREAIEAAYGSTLDWRDISEVSNRRTKIVAERVPVSDRTTPTDVELEGVTTSARNLIDATRPWLELAYETASSMPANTKG